MDLEIRVELDGEGATVWLAGECDLATAPDLREALKALTPPDVTEVVVDLSLLHYLSSVGLGILLGTVRRLREHGGDLKVRGAKSSVANLLSITGVDTILTVDGQG